jgi:hypothetical protein
MNHGLLHLSIMIEPGTPYEIISSRSWINRALDIEELYERFLCKYMGEQGQKAFHDYDSDRDKNLFGYLDSKADLL